MNRDEINDQINQRIEEARLRDDLDMADPTALFDEADKERETIRSQAATPDVEPNPVTGPALKGIHSAVASPPLSVSVTDGVLAINIDSTSSIQQARGTGGGDSTSSGTVRMIFIQDGAEVTYDVQATPV